MGSLPTNLSGAGVVGGDYSALESQQKHSAAVGWVEMLSVGGVWVVRAVPPPTCAHVGSVGALDTPKLCPVGLEPAHARSERTVATQDVKRENEHVKWRQFE